MILDRGIRECFLGVEIEDHSEFPPGRNSDNSINVVFSMVTSEAPPYSASSKQQTKSAMNPRLSL